MPDLKVERPMSKAHPLIATPITPTLLRGFIELEHTSLGVLPHRLPAKARAQCSDPQLLMVEAQPSGVRLIFRTTARLVELDVLPTRRQLIGLPARPNGVYELCVDGRLERQASAEGATILRIDMSTGTTALEPGLPQTLRFADLPDGDKLIEIWLPHNETTELIGLRADAPIEPVAEPGLPVWLHHGSSISQGSNALSPTGIWPVIAARACGLELTNLGFGGSALLDPFTARTMRNTPADVISVKIGINLVNLDLMRLRAFGPAVDGFLDTIREGHPETPLLVVSPLLCPIHEITPGPGMFDMEALANGETKFLASGNPDEIKAGKLNLTVIRDQLAKIVERRARDDKNIHYLDGRALYGEQDNASLPLPDRLHPDAATHRLIGERFVSTIKDLLVR